MELYIAIPLFIVALILVIKGGDIFVDASIKIATKSKIPTIIVGATIVSLATTLPELIVSSIASIQGSYDLAIGNALGSVICNTSLICAISLIFAPTIIKNKTSNFKNYMLIFSLILLGVFCVGIEQDIVNGELNLFEGALLIIMTVIFMAVNIADAKKEIKNKLEYDKLYAKEKSDKPNTQENNVVEDKYGKLISFFLLGAAMVGAGAYGLIESATSIAYSLHISESVVGLTIVAIGTSLPELVTTITSLRKKNNTLGYGNVIGANILNITLIIGTSACISGINGISIGFWTLVVSLPVAIISTLIFILPMVLKQKTYRWQGLTLLGIYLAYMAFLIIMTINGITI